MGPNQQPRFYLRALHRNETHCNTYDKTYLASIHVEILHTIAILASHISNASKLT